MSRTLLVLLLALSAGELTLSGCGQANDDDASVDDDDTDDLITCPGDFEVGAVDTEGDLALLANCAVIGALWVHDTSLTHLDGLSSLASVLGRLAIQSNDALTNVDGLSSLTSVGGGCTSTETKTYSTSTVCRASLQWEGA